MNPFMFLGLFVCGLMLSCEDPRGAVPKRIDPSQFLKGGDLIFEDDFNRAELGPDWNDKSQGKWSIKDGMVYGANARNDGLWLNTPIPANVRVEFEAISPSKEGDLKCEIFALKQQHTAGYIVIFGGWENQINTIARLDEHGEDRIEERTLRNEMVNGKETVVDHRVKTGQKHKFSVIRKGKTIYWFVDGSLYLTFEDDHPVKGPYFGFNDWLAPVQFDNVKVYRLGY